MKETTEGLAGWAKFITTVGVPSAIALYLVWTLTAGIANATQVETLNRKVEEHTAVAERQQSDLLGAMETQIRLARAICRSVAKSEPARLECDR